MGRVGQAVQRAAVPAAQEVAGGAQNGPLPRETRCRTFAVVESGDTLATKGIAGLTTGCPTKNVKWHSAVPGEGWSSPVVVKGRVYLTTAVVGAGLSLRVLCFDAATGKQNYAERLEGLSSNWASPIADAAGHLIIASVLGAPVAVLIGQIMVPDPREVQTTDAPGAPEAVATSTMDAISKGTMVGLELLLNIVAMLIVLVALVTLVNSLLGLLPGPGGGALSMQGLLGWLLAPLAWLTGIPWEEAREAGALLVSGRLERSEGVVNVVAERIEALAMPAAASVRSRDFH
mgnify:CR=1 FL=1